ncbi:hypothetical protein GDO86_011406 [Hymenochirus boettgeri]|uniref:Uncharacterized protein n=1 Tax=Hymenochirus boettgeri TaxID=247094 RepID=A0A8T2JJ09_9PIPI|nr:hypothetical protein GDO86_011406 [Hymenochirus boettgeri]KAG8442602.1 hypothetical protein GDO86_011406 [Hymenochirus boettgeri]
MDDVGGDFCGNSVGTGPFPGKIKPFSQKTGKFAGKNNKKSLLDYIEDPSRNDPLVGLHYVVEVRLLNNNKSVYKCTLCHVKGEIASMMEHLTGWQHLKVFMVKEYSHILQEVQRKKLQKHEFNKYLRKRAAEIEKKESVRCIKVEYVNTTEKIGNIDFWNTQIYDQYLPYYKQQKIKDPSDRRQIALHYLEKFRISSRTEANEVLNLTEYLNKLLENFFIKSGGENMEQDSAYHSATDKNSCEYPLRSGPESRKRKASWTYNEPHTSSTYVYPYGKVQYPGVAQCSAATKTFFQASSFPEPSYNPYTSEILPKSTSQITHSSVEEHCKKQNANYQDYCLDPEVTHADAKPVNSNVPSSVDPSGSDAESCLLKTSVNSNLKEQSSETEISSSTSGKALRTLSPDTLQLLKGKDLNTVIKILKTISPFYPALQEVNIEMFAQVLHHAGALD